MNKLKNILLSLCKIGLLIFIAYLISRINLILGYIAIIIIIRLIIPILNSNKKEKHKYYNADESYTIEEKINYKNAYEPKYLMTINEKAQYRKLRQWANQHSLIIFCKVRLLDLITPRKNQENYKGALWKIQAKHVDFVICDQDIRIKCIVEISDRSHSRQDRAERDNFVSEVLEACGYKVLMTYNVTDDQLNNICGYAQPTKEQEIKHE